MPDPSPRPRAPRHILLPSSRAVFGGDVDEGSIFFVGSATTILRYRGITILTDPSFIHRGERVRLGHGLHATRLTEPALGIDQLPDVDLVLVSHLHEDHFDRVASEKLDRGLPMISTPQATSDLSRQGFRATHALPPWSSVDVMKGSARLTVTATPTEHGPPLVAALMPPAMGSMLDFEAGDGGRFRIWVSGDTLVHDRLGEIRRRWPDIDLALLHLGGMRLAGVLVTMDGREGADAMRIVQPRTVIPIHYDDYSVFRSPLDEFRSEADAAGLGARVHYLARGETYRFHAPSMRPRREHEGVRSTVELGRR